MTEAGHRHWRWMEVGSGYRSPFCVATARGAYTAGFANDAWFVIAVSVDGKTWHSLTRPQFERLANRLETVETVEDIARLMHAEQWSEADLFGDLIAQREGDR